MLPSRLQAVLRVGTRSDRIGLAKEVQFANPEFEKRKRTFPLYHSVHGVPYGTNGLL